MAKCLYCGKTIRSGLKYCSNKGRGNHKDKYWNTIRYYNGDLSESRKRYLGITDSNDMEIDYEQGWDTHKDM